MLFHGFPSEIDENACQNLFGAADMLTPAQPEKGLTNSKFPAPAARNHRSSGQIQKFPSGLEFPLWQCDRVTEKNNYDYDSSTLTTLVMLPKLLAG